MESVNRMRMKRFGVHGIAFVLYAGVAILWAALTILLFWISGSNWDNAAKISDSFGAVNALFTALAFVGVIHAILLQKSELELQREELALQRKEIEQSRLQLQRSADAQQKSEVALREQVNCQFFTAYFNAIRDLQELGDTKRQTIQQRHAFDRISRILNQLDRQAESILGTPIITTSVSEHACDCLKGLCERARQSARKMTKIDALDSTDELMNIVQEFTTLLDSVESDLGDAFAAHVFGAYLAAKDLTDGISNGKPSKDLASHANSFAEELEVLRSIVKS